MEVLNGPDAAKLYRKYSDLIEKESDRGAIIVSVSLLDAGLESLLKAKLVDSVSNNDSLFDGPTAPLGSFAAKTEVAYRTGLIRLSVKKQFSALRKIRNDFAHRIEFESLDEEPYRSKMLSMIKLSPEIFAGIEGCASQAASKLSPDFLDKDILTIIGIRNVFNIMFATQAAAINRVHLSVKKTEELV